MSKCWEIYNSIFYLLKGAELACVLSPPTQGYAILRKWNEKTAENLSVDTAPKPDAAPLTFFSTSKKNRSSTNGAV